MVERSYHAGHVQSDSLHRILIVSQICGGVTQTKHAWMDGYSAQPPQEDLDRHYHDETHEHLLLFRSRFEKFESLITELHTKLQVRRHLVRCSRAVSTDLGILSAAGD